MVVVPQKYAWVWQDKQGVETFSTSMWFCTEGFRDNGTGTFDVHNFYQKRGASGSVGDIETCCKVVRFFEQD